MQLRLLPRDEWAAKLAGTELETIWPVLPEGSQVLVVEDGGELLACWSIYPQFHVEGLWVRPDSRKNPRIGRRLLFGMAQIARALGARSVQTAAVDEGVAGMLEKIGAVELRGRHFSLTIK